MKDHYFYIHVFPNGEQKISSISHKMETSLIYLILDQLGHSTKELESFKLRIIDARDKKKKQLVGYNTLYVIVSGKVSEIGQNDFEPEEFQIIPTEELLTYIDDAIKFRILYNSGGIPGIIPKSKKDEWSIVSNEYIKKGYWQNLESKNNSE